MLDYTEDQWRIAAGHRPASPLLDEQLRLLHRHWMWANIQREAFDAELAEITTAEVLERHMSSTSRMSAFLYAWYAFLQAVIEACTDPGQRRQLDFRGEFQADLVALGPDFRRFRNAVFHVPADYNDPRLEKFMTADTSIVDRIRRVHRGFGRLLLEEWQARKVQQ
jgi:hypothetical protein